MYKIVILGPPGSGKGTQAKLISEALNIPTISTGHIFRDEIKNQTELGIKITAIMDSGGLVSDHITNEIVAKRLQQDDVQNGYILDGYPRNIVQVEYLDKLDDLTRAVNIDCSDSVVTDRMAARRTCSECGANFNILFKPTKKDGVCDGCQGALVTRADGEPDAIKERIYIYHQQDNSVLDFYKNKGILLNIDGEPSIEEVWQEIKVKLNI
jgi:adenylate kinase